MRVVGYIRVSSIGQVEDGQGLAIQEQAIRRWAREHRHRLVAVHRDEGVSGRLEPRDGLEEALSAVRFNGAEGLVVASLDRLARSLTVQEAALQQAWSAGGRVFAVDTGEVLADDPEDPVRTFVRQVLGAVSQLEAGMIARRLRRGRLHKAESGGYAHGAPRYGWRAEGGELVPDPAEQAVVERIRALRADGASLRDIAGVLNAEGVRSKRGGRWHPATVARVAG
ncbi:MAG: recombinase family protein [Acidimicrobiia bacterium]